MGAGQAKEAKTKFDTWELAMLNVMFDELVAHSESPNTYVSHLPGVT